MGEAEAFSLIFILMGVISTFIIPALIYLYPRLPLVPSPKSWEKLPDEVQVKSIKNLRKLCMVLYAMGGSIFLFIGIYTYQHQEEMSEKQTVIVDKGSYQDARKKMVNVPGIGGLNQYLIRKRIESQKAESEADS